MATDNLLLEALGEELISGQLRQADATRLDLFLTANRGARQEVAEVLLLHGLLAARAADPDQALAAVKARIGQSETGDERAPGWSGRWSVWRALGVAAALALLLLLGLRWLVPQPNDGEGFRLVGGHVEGVVPGQIIPADHSLQTGSEPAELLCGAATRIRVAARSRVVAHGQTRTGWQIELTEGEVSCAVSRDEYPFRVETVVADVVTEGTVFRVRLGTAGTGERHLLVGVDEGTVRVQAAGAATLRVAAGEQRIVPNPVQGDRSAAARVALALLFPDRSISRVEVGRGQDELHAEAETSQGEVEMTLSADGMVRECGYEVSGAAAATVLPAALKTEVERSYGPEVRWREVSVLRSGGRTTYEVTFAARGRKLELQLDATGKPVQ